MNSGLTSLMMWMLNSGNDKKRAEEYDRRQKESEARQERLMVARDAVAQMRAAANTADERKWQLDSEERKIAQKLNEDKRSSATKQEHINYGLKTMKQNSGIPFETWASHEQEAVLALPGMTMENAALIIAKINAGASVAQVKADLAKLSADTAKNANDERAALTASPYVERTTQLENANKIARLNLGDRSPSDLGGPEKMVTMNQDMHGGYKLQDNPFRASKGDDLDALLGAGKPKSNADANAALAGGVITPKVVDAVNSSGEVVPVVTKNWPKDTGTTTFNQPSTQAPTVSRSALNFADDVRMLQGATQTNETVESLAEKYRREKEELDARYRLPVGYIDRFSP